MVHNKQKVEEPREEELFRGIAKLEQVSWSNIFSAFLLRRLFHRIQVNNWREKLFGSLKRGAKPSLSSLRICLRSALSKNSLHRLFNVLRNLLFEHAACSHFSEIEQ